MIVLLENDGDLHPFDGPDRIDEGSDPRERDAVPVAVRRETLITATATRRR